MSTGEKEKNPLDKWREGIGRAVGNPRWNIDDCEIKAAVGEYNRHLQGVAGYRQLDWRLIKAMLWVETGAERPAWRTNPMQIGVTGDPGSAALLSPDGGGVRIIPAAWRGKLKMSSARTIPTYNIRAGIGYLLMRAARFEHQSVVGDDGTVYLAEVRRGDSLARVAQRHGTTIEILRSMNPSLVVLHQGQSLKYRKGTVERVITGWRNLDVAQVARLYNGFGDPRYAQKLDYAYALVNQGEEAKCE